MKNSLRILTFFMEHREEFFSIYAVSQRLNINYRIAFQEIKKLVEEKALTLEKLGNSNQCTFNYVFIEKVLTVEQQKKENLLKERNLKVLDTRLQEIKNPFYIALVFGSYAAGKQTKQSDIDLCIVTDHEDIRKKAGQIIRTLALPIHYLDFSTQEFISMLKTTEENVGKEIMKKNILLQGVEDFYRMVSYAR